MRRFIGCIASGNWAGSIRALKDYNVLPLACALICPVEQQCEVRCSSSKLTYPIMIARLQEFISRHDLEHGFYRPKKAEAKGVKIAVVGAGPAGLACAFHLAVNGYDATIFEKASKAGGVLGRAVPKYRLPRELVEQEIGFIRKMGVDIQTGVEINSVDDLFDQGFAAVFLATGLWASAFAGLGGEDLDGVHSAMEVLEAAGPLAEGQPLPMTIGERVVVIGGGSVAMDVTGIVLRHGARKAEIVCLEAPNEMPAAVVEADFARSEGVIFHTRVKPLRIVGDNGRVTGLEGVAIEWREPDKFVPSNAVEIEGSQITLKCDSVVEAIGQRPEPSAQKLFEGLKTERGRPVVDPETMATSREGVYAAGDVVVGGGMTAARALFEGTEAAKAIRAYLAASS